MFETLKKLWHSFAYPEYDGEEKLAQGLRDYVREPGFVGDPSTRPLIVNPTPCASCHQEVTVLMHPDQMCWECFTNAHPLHFPNCRCDDCCERFAHRFAKYFAARAREAT